MHYFIHQEKKGQVPGLLVLGVLIIVIGVFATIFSKVDKTEKVSEGSQFVERVDVTNLRDKSLTLFWKTADPTTGYVLYGLTPENINTKAVDELDTSALLTPRTNHVVNILDLPSNTPVYFKLVIDGKHIGQAVDVPYTVETNRKLVSPLDAEPLYGTIARSTGVVEPHAVVIARVGSSMPLLTRSSSDGSFLFSQCCLYSGQTKEPFIPAEDEKIRIEVISEDGTVREYADSLSNMSPLEVPILVDQQGSGIAGTSTFEESEPEVLSVADTAVDLDPIDIIFPRENASIPASRPLIRGVGEPGQRVKGEFNNVNKIFQVEVDKDRNWYYEPSFDFPPGGHEMVVTTADDRGQILTLTRAFTILKSGESVLGDATGEGELTPTLSPTATPVATLVPTTVATSSATPTPPVTGFSILPIALVSIVIIAIGAGFILLF